MAEVLFTMGNTYLYEFKEQALENALESFQKGELIIKSIQKEEMLREEG